MSDARMTVVQLPPPKLITPRERFEALMLAKLNEEKAALCGPEQGPLRAIFELNSKFLSRIASR
jgi:hypothetical protein